MRTPLRWLWPGGLILLADLALLRWSASPEAVAGWTGTYGGLVLGTAALLAWRFRRSRTVALVVVLGLISLADPGMPGLPGEAGEALRVAARLLDPRFLSGTLVLAGTAVLALTRDRSPWSPIGGFQVMGMAALAAAGLFIASLVEPADLPAVLLEADGVTWLAETRRDAPRAFWLALALAGAVTVVQAVRLDHTAERGLVWTVVGLALGTLAEPGSVEGRVHLAATGLILMLTSVETSYALAFRDELTGLPTRRALTQFFDSVVGTYTVAMVDVDHFKKFNDRHGHDVGDQVLKMVASRLDRVGGGGTAFRYGGEEFTLVFPGKSREEARPFLEAIRESVASASFTVRRFGRPRQKPAKGKSGRAGSGRRNPRKLSVTVSVGAADRSGEKRDPASVIRAADRALYRAKRAGRNRVAV